MNTEINIGLYKNTTAFCVPINNIKITEGNQPVGDVKVEITIPTGVTFTHANITRGTYDSTDPALHVWNIGTLQPGETLNGETCFTVADSCEGPFEFPLVLSSGSCATCCGNDEDCITITGISCCEVLACIELSNNEQVYEVPSSAFADTSRPTLAELNTWATNVANVPLISQDNGTVLVYNRLSFVENIVYSDINVSLTSLGPAEANTKIFRVVINGTNYDQDFPATSDAAFDEVAFKNFIDASMATEGVTGTVVVTEDIDGSTQVDVDITVNVGIDSFGIVSKSDITDPLESSYDLANGAYTNNGGRKSFEYIWVMNDDGGMISITEVFKAQNDGKVLYVRTGGFDAVAELGDPNRPYKTLKRALREATSSDLIKVYLQGDENLIVNFEDFAGRKVKVIGESEDDSAIVVLNTNNNVDSATLLTITGDFRTTNATTPIELDSSFTDQVFIRDAILINDGSVPAVSSDATTNILVQNVVTNVIIANEDSDVVQEGQSFIMDTDYI